MYNQLICMFTCKASLILPVQHYVMELSLCDVHRIYRHPTMHDHARSRVHLFTLTASITYVYIWTQLFVSTVHVVLHQSYPITANIFLFSLLGLKIPSDAPEQELILHTTFGKNAKGLEQLSANIPRRIIELSVRQWRNHVW